LRSSPYPAVFAARSLAVAAASKSPSLPVAARWAGAATTRLSLGIAALNSVKLEVRLNWTFRLPVRGAQLNWALKFRLVEIPDTCTKDQAARIVMVVLLICLMASVTDF
jgi:hypothetical protein